MTQRAPVVLFAAQAPTLLNLLANTDAWDLRCEPMGDAAGLAESALLDPRIKGLDHETPDLIVVCSPDHLRAAEQLQADIGQHIPVVWAAHNGYEPHLTHKWQGPVLTFSTNNIHAHVPDSREQVYVIRPHLPIVDLHPRQAMCAAPHPFFWTMQNRPSTRNIITQTRTSLVARAVDELSGQGVHLRVYGQDQTHGFLSPEARREHLIWCPAYVSGLPSCAGFGLAEHEALAAGSPLIAYAWGDTFVTLAGYPGLVHSFDQLKERLALRALDDIRERSAWKSAGFDLLQTHYTRRIMEQGIERLLDGLLGKQ